MEEYSAFSKFIGKYGRSYATHGEHYDKFEAFKLSYRDVKAHNEKYKSGEVTWKKTIN